MQKNEVVNKCACGDGKMVEPIIFKQMFQVLNHLQVIHRDLVQTAVKTGATIIKYKKGIFFLWYFIWVQYLYCEQTVFVFVFYFSLNSRSLRYELWDLQFENSQLGVELWQGFEHRVRTVRWAGIVGLQGSFVSIRLFNT